VGVEIYRCGKAKSKKEEVKTFTDSKFCNIPRFFEPTYLNDYV
jgi:hypothetical protein